MCLRCLLYRRLCGLRRRPGLRMYRYLEYGRPADRYFSHLWLWHGLGFLCAGRVIVAASIG